MYSNKLIELFKILKDYNIEIENIIVSDNIEFNNKDLNVLIENIMCDLKDLNRNI